MDTNELVRLASERRARAVTMIARAKAGHTGEVMRCLDVLSCLCYGVMHVHALKPLAMIGRG